MTNAIFKKVSGLVCEYYPDFNELLHDLNGGALPRDITPYAKAIRLVQNGGFAVYYTQVEEDMRGIYGDEYDESRYRKKSGEFKTKNGDVYIWSVYQHLLALAIEKMVKQAGVTL